tara:strand:- start:1052 stop:1231 length:180 start_codon:yes stop_codon:yes gene_type:complete
MFSLNKMLKEVKTSQERLNKKDIKFLLSICISVVCDVKLDNKDRIYLYRYMDYLTNLNK